MLRSSKHKEDFMISFEKEGLVYENMPYHKFVENQVSILMSTDLQLQKRLSSFYSRVKLFFLLFSSLNICLNIIRFNLPEFTSSTSQVIMTWCYIPIMFISFGIEVAMIFYFYRTGMRFVTIL